MRWLALELAGVKFSDGNVNKKLSKPFGFRPSYSENKTRGGRSRSDFPSPNAQTVNNRKSKQRPSVRRMFLKLCYPVTTSNARRPLYFTLTHNNCINDIRQPQGSALAKPDLCAVKPVSHYNDEKQSALYVHK